MRSHAKALVVVAALLAFASPAGADDTLSPPGSTDSCPNAAVRVQQGASGLAGCRAYEQISPMGKGGISVDTAKTVQGSPDGEAVAYSAPGAFAGASTSLTGQYYIGSRAPESWSTDPVDAPQLNTNLQIATPTFWFTEGLSRAMQYSQRALLPGAIEAGANFYLRDNLTGARELALASDKTSEITNPLLPFTTRNPVGASSDLSHFVFSVRAQLLPEAAPGAINAYEIVNGELRLINVLDDESVDPGGGQVGGSAAGRATRTISADGSRVFFQSPNLADFAFGALYMRVNGTTTIPISVSHRPGDPSGAVPVTFHGISRDGSIVYFSSTTPLTEDATGGGAYGDLYRYDVQTDELKNLTVLTDPADTTADVATVVGISENGADVYFVSAANLTGDTSPGQQSIYVSYGDELHHVAVLGEGESSGPQQVKLSPSGRYLVFATWGQPTGQDNLNPLACKATAFSARPAGSCIETYVYDAVEDELSCMSCEPVSGGVRDAGMGIQNASVSEYKSRAVLDDGRAFFNTTARLAPADSNGRSDVYEWQDGEVSLISPGTANQDATFAEASADGRDVFFFTAQALVAQDVDRDVDLYDARAGGGMASQSQPRPAAPTCSGESCQGVAASPPGLVPTSTAFVGPHDPKPRRVQKKNKRRHRHSRNGSHKGTHKGPHKKRSSHAGKGRATKDHGGSR